MKTLKIFQVYQKRLNGTHSHITCVTAFDLADAIQQVKDMGIWTTGKLICLGIMKP